MAYHMLRIIIPFMRIPLVYGSSAPLDNILYHKNVPVIMQSLGSIGYLPLIHRLIAHSITLPCSFMKERDQKYMKRRTRRGFRGLCEVTLGEDNKPLHLINPRRMLRMNVCIGWRAS